MLLPLPEDQAVTSIEANEGIMPTLTADAAEPGQRSLGARLRAARESYGWSVAEIGTELRLPARLIERLENDDYTGISDAVFLRGYLTSYARLVEVPLACTQTVLAEHAHVAPLVATGAISRSRYLLERYSASATYLVLTAIIVVPAVWLATHGGLRQEFTQSTPLDPPARVVLPVATSTDTATALDADAAKSLATTSKAPAAVAAPAAATVPGAQTPIVASMTPFQVSEPSRAAEAPTQSAGSATPNNGDGAHVITLKIAQPSWVEVTTADGRKLEYSMLAADSEHEYRSDGSLSLRIGNSEGAQISADGKPIDLAPFRRGNVAHLRLFGSGEATAERPQQ